MTIKDFQEDQVVYVVTFYLRSKKTRLEETTVNSIWRKYLRTQYNQAFMRVKEDDKPYLVGDSFYKYAGYFDGICPLKVMLFADKSVADKFILEFETNGTIDGNKHYKTLKEHWNDAAPTVERMYMTANGVYVGLIEKEEAIRLYGDWRYNGGHRFGDDAEQTWVLSP